MKSHFLGLIIFLFSLTACTKEPSVELIPSNKPLLLSEFKSDNDITRFDYNTDSTLNKLFFTTDPFSQDQNVTYNVKYLSGKRVNELIGSNGTVIKISYNGNRLSKSEIFAGATLVSKSEYIYTADQISSVLMSLFSANSSIGTLKFKFDFILNSNKNVSSSKFFALNPVNNQYVEESIVNFQFDNKNNPFSSAGDLMVVFWQYANTNNIIKQENRDLSGDLLELIETTYTYNTFGYPTKAAMKITEPGLQPVTSQLIYTYK
ncbi:MAG: hypothetical protein C0446_01505 [Chitinophaga sp.]|nr:hypothetical protein [Chitinophaga sp.]